MSSYYHPDEVEEEYSREAFGKGGSVSAKYVSRYCGNCNRGWVYLPPDPGKKLSHKVIACRCRLEFTKQ